jgi:hypothetical protein
MHVILKSRMCCKLAAAVLGIVERMQSAARLSGKTDRARGGNVRCPEGKRFEHSLWAIDYVRNHQLLATLQKPEVIDGWWLFFALAVYLQRKTLATYGLN